VSAPIDGAGDPLPQLKLRVGSTRVKLRPVRLLLSKYSPRRPSPVGVGEPAGTVVAVGVETGVGVWLGTACDRASAGRSRGL